MPFRITVAYWNKAVKKHKEAKTKAMRRDALHRVGLMLSGATMAQQNTQIYMELEHYWRHATSEGDLPESQTSTLVLPQSQTSILVVGDEVEESQAYF